MLVAFAITPLGTGEGVGEIVAEAVRVVRESGLPNQTDAMFTTVEGDWVSIDFYTNDVVRWAPQTQMVASTEFGNRMARDLRLPAESP
jgi:uncharacterized protein YqgV (UPF0045/DUF77 family)